MFKSISASLFIVTGTATNAASSLPVQLHIGPMRQRSSRKGGIKAGVRATMFSK
jgi:hypothetical protein